jgi:hypothetical protein
VGRQTLLHRQIHRSSSRARLHSRVFACLWAAAAPPRTVADIVVVAARIRIAAAAAVVAASLPPRSRTHHPTRPAVVVAVVVAAALSALLANRLLPANEMNENQSRVRVKRQSLFFRLARYIARGLKQPRRINHRWNRAVRSFVRSLASLQTKMKTKRVVIQSESHHRFDSCMHVRVRSFVRSFVISRFDAPAARSPIPLLVVPTP